MSFSLLPDLIAEKLTDIPPELLHSRGIRLLMLDFDNTIVPYTTDKPTAQMARWLEQMRHQQSQFLAESPACAGASRYFHGPPQEKLRARPHWTPEMCQSGQRFDDSVKK